MSQASAFHRYHRADVDGVRIHYRRMGSGDPIVLLHGFPETSLAWRKVMPRLAERYTVIAPDLRGCGASDRPESGYDKQSVAADINGLVRQLGFSHIRLVSHDVGMMTGYAYAATYRDQVDQVVLMEAAIPGLGLEKLYDATRYPRMYHLPLFEAPNGLAEALITGRERMFVDHFMRQQAYDPDALADALDEYARCLAQPGALRAGIAYFTAHKVDAPRNCEHAKRKLEMPVLSIGGTASFGADLEGEVAALAADHRHVMIDECGHYIAEEQPEKLVEHLLTFFKGDR
jgi:pimeloyl-ACP methyl ester carboxylesterase